MAPPKGSSNNPNGRPKKDTALTDMLKVSLGHTFDYEGKKVSGKRILSDLVSKALITGRLQFPDDEQVSIISVKDWFELAKWAYERIDGKPVQPVGGAEELGPIIVKLVSDAES
jgi:hypothetical protein